LKIKEYPNITTLKRRPSTKKEEKNKYGTTGTAFSYPMKIKRTTFIISLVFK
jgi:hypothetical protein